MKKLSCLSVIILFILNGAGHSQNYQAGDILRVVAPSGLRLRTQPHFNAETIFVLQFGDDVQVSNTYGFDQEHRDTTNWLTGHWIYVSANPGISSGEIVGGFVFDGYLTSLALPSHENQLCLEPCSFTEPLQYYLRHHYPPESEQSGTEQSELVNQCMTFHKGNITTVYTSSDGWQKTQVQFQGYRFSEVMNLLRSMLVGKDMRDQFEDRLLFFKDRNGNLTRVQFSSDHEKIRLESRENGILELTIMLIQGKDCC